MVAARVLTAHIHHSIRGRRESGTITTSALGATATIMIAIGERTIRAVSTIAAATITATDATGTTVTERHPACVACRLAFRWVKTRRSQERGRLPPMEAGGTVTGGIDDY
jgi:hypothetical protein